MTSLCFVTLLASPSSCSSLSSPSLTADHCGFFRKFHAKRDQFTKRCILPFNHGHDRHNADTADNQAQKSTSTGATWKMTTSSSPSSSSSSETETESTATTTSATTTTTTTTTGTQSPTSASTSTDSNNEAGTSARCEDARRLALWLSAEWSNRDQAIENPPLWSHIHVTFRPLPWSLLNGYAMYSESAYDYDLSTPYKTSVVHIVNSGSSSGELELASYKINRDPDEFWSGVFEPSLLEPLTRDHLTKLRDECNTVFKWIEEEQAFVAMTRPGKQCRIRRSPNEVETYLDCRILLTDKTYSAWDIGKDPETDQRVWGTVAGPFQFSPVQRFRDSVPDEE